MKSKQKSFNTALRKNLTRFAPCWVLYTIGNVMVLLLMMQDSRYWFAQNIGDWILAMPVINLGYALLTALLLFGDLFNSRICNALHAMPLRRESWFAANAIAGLLYSLIPTLVTALIAVPVLAASNVENGWQIPLYWLLGGNLSYLCFFGIALLCIHLTGNRFATAVVYGIVNFAAVILYWLVDTLYTPMIYGIRTWAEPFFRLTPIVHMMEEEYLDVVRVNLELANSPSYFTLTENWWRLGVWAAVGLVCLGTALLLYRKRKLECAGDFMAFRKMEPVFLIIYTLIVGTCFQFFASNLIGFYGDLVYLFVGLAVGWFTGKMLLKRTLRVFRRKSIGGCLLTLAVVGLSLVLTALDVFGIESWVPQVSEVEAAYVTMGYSYNGRIPTDGVKVTNPEDLEKVLYIHENSIQPPAVREPIQVTAETWEGDEVYAWLDKEFTFTLCYQLKNGRLVYRYYRGYADTEVGEILSPWFSTVSAVTGLQEEELQNVVDTTHTTYLLGVEVALTTAQRQELMDAIVADCQAGHMVQRTAFHEAECYNRNFSVEFSYSGEDRLSRWLHVTVYPCCENVYRWMDENNMWPILEENPYK